MLSKEDFQKRKRVKNVVPQFERCGAKRANGEQCTRRKKDDSCFCGTHVKGTPHGEVSTTDDGLKGIEVSVVSRLQPYHYPCDNILWNITSFIHTTIQIVISLCP